MNEKDKIIWGKVILSLSPLAKALFLYHSEVGAIPTNSPKISIEVRNRVLLKIAKRFAPELEQAFNRELKREISLCLYTLEPLRALTKLAVSDGQGD